MMQIGIRVAGTPADLTATHTALAGEFPHLTLEQRHGWVLTTRADADSAIETAARLAQRVETVRPKVVVCAADWDVVAAQDVAARMEVPVATANGWAEEEGFPAPFASSQVLGADVWVWTSVAAWLRTTKGMNVGADLPPLRTLAEIEIRLREDRADSAPAPDGQ